MVLWQISIIFLSEAINLPRNIFSFRLAFFDLLGVRYYLNRCHIAGDLGRIYYTMSYRQIDFMLDELGKSRQCGLDIFINVTTSFRTHIPMSKVIKRIILREQYVYLEVSIRLYRKSWNFILLLCREYMCHLILMNLVNCHTFSSQALQHFFWVQQTSCKIFLTWESGCNNFYKPKLESDLLVYCWIWLFLCE